MQRVVRTLFRMRGGKSSQPVSSYSAASRLSIAALAILSVGGLLSQSAAAQTSPQAPVTRIRTKQPLSPEILAMHARVKRPVATAPTTSLELAATAPALTSSSFNSEQGPGPGPIGPGPGCNLFPAPP